MNLLYLFAPEEVVVDEPGQFQEMLRSKLLRHVASSDTQVHIESGCRHRLASARQIVVLALTADDMQYGLLRNDLDAEFASSIIVAGSTLDMRLFEHQLLYLLQVDIADLHPLRRYLVPGQDRAYILISDEAVGDAVNDLDANTFADSVLCLSAELPDSNHEVAHHCQKQEYLYCSLHDRGRSMSVIC